MVIERLCIHNGAIDCNNPRCSIKCGWNPRGETARKKLIETNGLTKKEDGTRCLVLKKKVAQ